MLSLASKQNFNINLHFYIFRAFLLAIFVCVLSTNALSKVPPESFADLSDSVSPAVVNIATSVAVKNSSPNDLPNFPPGSPFEEFFKDFNERGPSKRPSTALGSGFIISEDGLIVTNNHVIEGAEEITVFLPNEEEFIAKIIGRDTKTDLAVLKVDTEGKKLPFVEFGDSDILRVGDWVLAVGNPFGLGGTVTAGIVSARGREIGQGQYDDFIQTDASINRGNSGGPLFNMSGKVIGVNTAIFSQSGGSVGIGFAISSNLANSVVKQLVEFGRTRRGWLGVYIQDVTEEIASSLDFDETRGALVSSVRPGSPAEAAKIKPGDIVLSFDGKKIVKMKELPRIVAETEVGSEVTVEVWREGSLKKLIVVLGELEIAESSGEGPIEKTVDAQEIIDELGVTIAVMNSEISKQFDIDENLGKVVIIEVEEKGPAFAKDILPGTVIKRADRQDVLDIDDVLNSLKAVKERGSKALLLLLSDGKRERFVAINIRN
ncbi:MAG: serine protease [SAR116 cluster bacterium]|nr:serine protease [SAR116 cluster bacterium]